MVMPGVVGAELGAEQRFARQVEILRVGDDGAADHLVDVLALQVVAIDERVERAGHQVEIGEVGIEGVRAAEGNARSADHRDASQKTLHLVLPLWLECYSAAAACAGAAGVCDAL